jgi:hypothetical protein
MVQIANPAPIEQHGRPRAEKQGKAMFPETGDYSIERVSFVADMVWAYAIFIQHTFYRRIIPKPFDQLDIRGAFAYQKGEPRMIHFVFLNTLRKVSQESEGFQALLDGTGRIPQVMED